jgi:hypothetical protein
MIPIGAIANLTNGVLSTALGIRLYHRYRAKVAMGAHSEGVRQFIWFYASFALMWLTYSVPGIFTTSPITAFTIFSIADTLVFFSTAIGVQISFLAMGRVKLGQATQAAILAVGTVYVAYRFLNPLPAIPEANLPYSYWAVPYEPTWLPILSGGVAAFGTLLFISTFAVLGWRLRSNKLLFHRSLSLTFGMIFIFVSSTTFFFIASLPGGLNIAAFSSFLSIAGLLLMWRGIPHDEPPPASPVAPNKTAHTT